MKQISSSSNKKLLTSLTCSTWRNFSTRSLCAFKEVEFLDIRESLEGASAKHVQVVDVRTQQEFETAEHKFNIGFNLPVQTLSSNISLLDTSKPVYVVCQSGLRAKRAAEMLDNSGFKDVYCIKGGFNDIKNKATSNDPIVAKRDTNASQVWSLERQVRFTAGMFVAAGVAGFLASGNPYFLALPGFVGCGLMFASITNTCAMGAVLLKMPWNKVNPNVCPVIKK